MIVIGGVASTREREKERERERSASIRPPGHASCRRARKYIFSPSVRRATARQTDKYTFFEEISKRRLLRSESLEWRERGREGGNPSSAGAAAAAKIYIHAAPPRQCPTEADFLH